MRNENQCKKLRAKDGIKNVQDWKVKMKRSRSKYQGQKIKMHRSSKDRKALFNIQVYTHSILGSWTLYSNNIP